MAHKNLLKITNPKGISVINLEESMLMKPYISELVSELRIRTNYLKNRICKLYKRKVVKIVTMF